MHNYVNYHIATGWVITFAFLIAWETIWKGLGMWRAAQNKQTGWFVAILVLNTAGLLPIVYLLITGGDRHGNG